MKFPELCCSAASILELGAGTGLVGMTAAMLVSDASRVVLTDNNDRVLDLLRRNIDINFTHKQRESKLLVCNNSLGFFSLKMHNFYFGSYFTIWPVCLKVTSAQAWFPEVIC